MNIQIFGAKKCFDTKKAERYFKERNVKFQSIDIKEKGMSKDALALFKYIVDEDKLEKLLENQQLIKTPVVRNGKGTRRNLRSRMIFS